MKNNRGITVIVLVTVIVVITVILGIVVSSGYSLLEKSRAGKMITYMELIESRADTVYEEIWFETKSKDEFIKNQKIKDQIILDENEIEELKLKIENFNESYIYFEWNQEMLAKNGIEKNILNSSEFFTVAFDYDTQKIVGIYCYNGCTIDGVRYYSLEDLRENISK